MSSRSQQDDRTKRAQIRDAAIVCFAERGVTNTSMRDIAARAGVTAGLITHHFGTKEALRRECDLHVAHLIQVNKSEGMKAGISFNLPGSVRQMFGDVPVVQYLARTLTDGTAEVSDLIDTLAADAVERMKEGQESNLIRRDIDPESVGKLLLVWSLGSLVLHEHINRLLGVDLTQDLSTDVQRSMAYFRPAFEVMSQGTMTDDTAHMFRGQFDALDKEQDHD